MGKFPYFYSTSSPGRLKSALGTRLTSTLHAEVQFWTAKKKNNNNNKIIIMIIIIIIITIINALYLSVNVFSMEVRKC